MIQNILHLFSLRAGDGPIIDAFPNSIEDPGNSLEDRGNYVRVPVAL